MGTAKATTKTRMTQAERKALSDDRMFDAAVHLIVEFGPHRATLAEIGIRAGYSRGIATYRFGTKDEFFGALIEHLHQTWCMELERATSGTHGIDTVIAAVTALQTFVQSDPDRLRAMYKLYYHAIDHDSETTLRLQKIHASQRRQAMQWARECSSGSASGDLLNDFAEQYCALIFGAIYQWLVSPAKIDLVDLLGRCKKTLAAIAPG